MKVAEFRNHPRSSANKLTGYGLGGLGSVPVWTFTLRLVLWPTSLEYLIDTGDLFPGSTGRNVK
jgi:hypothetical protein